MGALVLVIGMLLVVLAVIHLGTLDARLVWRDVRHAEALYLAEAGLERGRAWLEAQDSPPEDTLPFYPFGDAPDTLGGGLYAVSIVPDPANPTIHPNRYTITATGSAGRHARNLELDVSPQSFSDFLYFTNNEHTQGGGDPVWFATGDRIDGPLHTNDQIHIFGNPIFAGSVRSGYGGPDDSNPSHEPAFEYFNGDPHSHLESAAASNPPHDIPVFEDGYDLGASMIELPSDAIRDFRDVAQDGGIYLTGGRDVVFARDDAEGNPMHGYVSYRSNDSEPWTDVEIASTNGIMYIGGHVTLLGGIVDGQLTIASNTAIDIENDIIYRDSDENGPTPDCDDLLGLVCTGDVTISDNEANQNDCVIHADIIATNTSFKAEHWASGEPRGTLTVHGGVCQNFRGAVGTGVWDGDQVLIQTGYAKDYHYDERLASMAPPGWDLFLLTGEYRRLAWRDLGS